MNIYINKRKGIYSGGLIIVAANSIVEAHGIMHAECGEFVASQYEYSDWELINELEGNYIAPTIIREHGYTE